MFSYLKQLLVFTLCLTITILFELLLNQLFYEFTPRLDIICITLFSYLNPFILFVLGIIKDMINDHILGLTSLLYLLLFIVYYHCKLKSVLSLIFIFFVQWAIGTVFPEHPQQIKGLIINFAVTLAILQGLSWIRVYK